MIYLDNAATTPMSQVAIDSMTSTLKTTFGNPSSIHQYGRTAQQYLRNARETIASHLQTTPNTILFTSGGSEADNIAIKGVAFAKQHLGKHIITTSIEHPAVLKTVAYLEQKFGFEVTYLDPIDGHIQAQQVQNALRKDTILVSVMHTNNETGQKLPIREIGKNLKDHQALFHVDAVQAIGKEIIHPKELGINLLSASGHKFHGPKGVGFLYHDNQVTFDALIHGGDQESKKRAGTENIAGIVGMASALDETLNNVSLYQTEVKKLKQQLLDGLEPLSYELNEKGETSPYVANLFFPNCPNNILLTKLDLSGIAVSTGSACTAGAIEPSHVLEKMYGSHSDRLNHSIRFSFSHYNTAKEIDSVIQTIKEILS